IVLKSARWITWMEEGFPTPPSLSFLVSVFMLIVLAMRVALWLALKMKKPLATSPITQSSTAPASITQPTAVQTPPNETQETKTI
ncbi:MAG: Ferric oxidoreductase protein, partial [Patescibacteria group bacterium]|nr:Ferric oxidoreductase protein [Patescibacteria group bacterium]